MAAPNINRVFRVAGKIYKNPTGVLTNPANYGVALGSYRNFEIESQRSMVPVFGEEFGRAVEFIDVLGNFQVSIRLRQWDEEMYETVFGSVQGVSPDKTINWPGAFSTGRKHSTRTINLLLVADRSDVANSDPQPSLIVRNCIPLFVDAMRLSVLREMQIPARFVCLDNTNMASMNIITKLTI